MNDREFSDIEIFQHSGKGILLFMTCHKNCLQADHNMRGVSSILKTERNKICAANISGQLASIKKIFPLKMKIKAVCIRFSNPVILDTVSSQIRTAVCMCLFRNSSAVISFKLNKPTDLNFNMNKRQGTLLNFGIKKSRIEGVCDATNNDSSTSSLQSDLQNVQKGKTTSTQKKKSAFFRKYMDSYSKFGFIQCPDTDQLPWPQCVICATVLGIEAMKPSRLIRHLNTKRSDLVNKPTEFFMCKREELKVQKKIHFWWHPIYEGDPKSKVSIMLGLHGNCLCDCWPHCCVRWIPHSQTSRRSAC